MLGILKKVKSVNRPEDALAINYNFAVILKYIQRLINYNKRANNYTITLRPKLKCIEIVED